MTKDTVPATAKGMPPKFNRSEILAKAWADYRRDEFKGWGVRRGEPFNRKHFGYCLRMAWAVTKELSAREAMPPLAPKPTKILTKAQVARAEAIRAEMFDLQMGDFIPWAQLTHRNPIDFPNHPFTPKPNKPVRTIAGGLSNDHHRKHNAPIQQHHHEAQNAPVRRGHFRSHSCSSCQLYIG